MKKIYLLIITSILCAQAVLSQNNKLDLTNDTIYINSIRHKINAYTIQKDSFLKLSKPKEAYMAITKADSLRAFLAELIFSNQEQNFIISQELSQKRNLEKILKWQNDSLSLIRQIAQKNSQKAVLQKEVSTKQINTLEEKRQLELLRKTNSLTQLRNKQIKEKIADEKRQAEEEIKIMIITILIFLLFMVGVYTYIKKKTFYAEELTKKMKEAQAARDAAIAAKEEDDKARMEAEKAATMKSVFIHNMSHEIRTPLNAVVGFSNVLTDKTMEIDNDSKQEFSTLIEKNSDLLTTLINDILDLSDLISGQYKMKYELTTANEICNTAFNTVKHRTPEGVTMSFAEPSNTNDIALWTDGGRVEQVLINYFTNACKYTAQGSIILTYQINEDSDTHKAISVCFSVTDTGSGIPAEKAESVFKRFEKLDDFKQGNGLGLNICRTIAERLGARCWLDTTYNTGCRFYLDIPIHCTKEEADEFVNKQNQEHNKQEEAL